jgi:hypothetical protein
LHDDQRGLPPRPGRRTPGSRPAEAHISLVRWTRKNTGVSPVWGGELRQALEGIESAVAAGFSHIKLKHGADGAALTTMRYVRWRISQTPAA